MQACVQVAKQHRVPLYPISAGRNWGLGSRVPAADGCALLDLSRMDRIVDFDEDLAHITVEPGVTFARVHKFLEARGSRLFATVIGGSPDASLIGNALERGEGTGPYGERWMHACALEVVLPSGDALETGFARFPGARTARTTRDGVGPSLEGLFTQSNLGVVTRMTFWLRPRPNDFRLFTCRVEDAAGVAGLLDALRVLALEDTLAPHCVTLWNSYKVLARMGRYPWRAMAGRTPLSLAERGGREPWFACGALYNPSAEMGRAAQARVESVLEEHGYRAAFADVTDRTAAFERTTFLGVPTDDNVRSVYWRKREDAPERGLDPDRDRCGVVWLCPEVPFEGASALEVIRLAEETLPRHGFEPNVGLMVRSPRSLKAFVAIVYDRDVKGEDHRALCCHDELLASYLDRGFVPYRLGIQSMDLLPATPVFDALIDRLKSALDPGDILAPGRYDFRARRPRT